MEALGMIETRGLLAAIESADVMLKSADVKLLEKILVGGGLVTITVTGDVAAVKSSIDAATAAVSKLGADLLVSQHVIPRPHVELGETIVSPVPLAELTREQEKELELEEKKEAVIETEESVTEVEEAVVESEATIEENEEPVAETVQEETLELQEITEPETAQTSELHKAYIDTLVAEKGIDKAIETLAELKVVNLRHLAREYEDFGIMGRKISKANKEELLDEFTKYYS